jgi:hypothetical protein
MTKRHRDNLTEHHEKGRLMAKRVLKGLRGKIGYEDVRQAIESLPDNTLLQVTIADLWLNLSKPQSLQRRRQNPPPSPFKKVGRDLVGVKGEIRDWDGAWLQIEHLRAGAKIYGVSGTWAARAQGAEFNNRLGVLLGAKSIVMGFVDRLTPAALAHALTQPSLLRVVDLTMDEVLTRTWWDKDEQLHVLDVYRRVLDDWRADVVAYIPPDE